MKGGRTPKQRGNRFEYYCKELLIKAGYKVTRSYGSLGPYDLYAEKDGWQTLLIQCKGGKGVPLSEAWNLLHKLAQEQGAIAVLVTRVNHRPTWYSITGPRAFRQSAKSLLKPFSPFGQRILL